MDSRQISKRLSSFYDSPNKLSVQCLPRFLPRSIHLSIHPSIHLSIHPSIHPFIYPSIHLFIHSLIYSFIHSLIYLFTPGFFQMPKRSVHKGGVALRFRWRLSRSQWRGELHLRTHDVAASHHRTWPRRPLRCAEVWMSSIREKVSVHLLRQFIH